MDHKEKFEQYKQAADAGNTNALVGLGNCYCNGRGVTKKYDKAYSLFKQAADAGSTNALVSIQKMYNTLPDHTIQIIKLKLQVEEMNTYMNTQIKELKNQMEEMRNDIYAPGNVGAINTAEHFQSLIYE